MSGDPWLDEAIALAKAWDARRERSMQKELGWSGMADCRQYMGYRLRDEWPSEERDTWRAITGTAMHAWLGQLRREAADPALNTEWEVPVSYRGIPGHADEICWTGREITDYKFPSLASASLWEDPEVQDERFIQPQGYAAGVISSPFWKHLHGSSAKATVRVLVAPVDGTFDDWKTYTRPFDRAVADDAADRYFRVVDLAAEGETDFPKDKPMFWCERFCLSGETEVVTRQGIRPISELAGSRHELLVPSFGQGRRLWHGSWQSCEVRSFGVQPLMAVRLRRGRQVKTVYATAEHRWITDSGVIVRTAGLTAGTSLKTIRRGPTSGLAEVPQAVAQGFTYGDGSASASTGAAASLSVYHASPKKPMLAYFNMNPVGTRDDSLVIGMLPRSWKRAPDLSESRSFLLSWLAGYLAADGTVSAAGQVTISSASLEAIQVARSVCALVGVGYGPVRNFPRVGFGQDEPSDLFSFTLRRADMPDWAFKLDHHHERAMRASRRKERYLPWKVEAVESTSRAEEVFCATVPGMESFALADDLLSMNCEFYSLCRGGEVRTGLPEITDPEMAAAIEMLGIANEVHAAAEKVRKQIAPMLAGAHGKARGFRVYRTKGGTGKYVPDPDAMSRRFERAGMEVPMKKVDGRAPLLKVVRDGKKGDADE